MKQVRESRWNCGVVKHLPVMGCNDVKLWFGEILHISRNSEFSYAWMTTHLNVNQIWIFTNRQKQDIPIFQNRCNKFIPRYTVHFTWTLNSERSCIHQDNYPWGLRSWTPSKIGQHQDSGISLYHARNVKTNPVYIDMLVGVGVGWEGGGITVEEGARLERYPCVVQHVSLYRHYRQAGLE